MQHVRVIFAVANGDRPLRPETVSKGLPRELWALAETCWCSRAESRPTAVEVLNQLESLLGKYG